MSIQIIDGFQVNTASPIDNRIVASGSSARDNIPYKYHGLRVFDISNNIPYVWNGSSWISENASGIVGSGTAEYIPLYTSSNVISNSLLYQYNGIIKTVDNGNGSDLVQIDPEYGSVYAQGGLYGPGSGITNMNATQITSGNLSLTRFTNGTPGWVFMGAIGSPTYSNPTQLTVGTSSVALLANLATTATTATTATNAVNVGITSNTANAVNYFTFVGSSTGNTNLKVNTGGLSYNPSTNITNTNGGDIYISSSSAGYVIRGTKTYVGFGLGNVGINPIIATITVPNNATVTVEVTFTGKVLEYDTVPKIVGRVHRSAKFVAAYSVSNTGTITQMGTTNTVLSVTSLGVGSVILNAGTIDILSSGEIKFKQSGTGPSVGGNTGNFSLTADYKVSIS